MSAVDVLAVMAAIHSLGGKFVPEWASNPIGTGAISRRARMRRNHGKLSLAREPSTATVLRAMQKAEHEGLVECVGTGAPASINANAACMKERLWVMTPAALARLGGSK